MTPALELLELTIRDVDVELPGRRAESAVRGLIRADARLTGSRQDPFGKGGAVRR